MFVGDVLKDDVPFCDALLQDGVAAQEMARSCRAGHAGPNPLVGEIVSCYQDRLFAVDAVVWVLPLAM